MKPQFASHVVCDYQYFLLGGGFMQCKLINHLAAAGLLLWAGAALAQTGVVQAAASAPSIKGLPNYPVASQQRAQAELAAQQGVPASELAAGAPQRYTIKRGDTLWGISGMYLKRPWNWPQLWGMNMAQIRNPHWIFPGQVLVLTVENGRARLGLDNAQGEGGMPTVKLEPGVISEKLPPSGIPALDPALIGPFLTRPLIVEPDELQQSPRIVAVAPGHVMLSPGDRAYVRGPLGATERFDVYRPGRPLHDPATKKIIAYESDYLGSVELIHPPQGKDAVATVRVLSTIREMGVGDRLIATPPRQYLNFTPHAPAKPMDAQIVSIYGDLQLAGKNSVVALNRGAEDGLERGDVLAILQAPREVQDTTVEGKPMIEIPARRIGLLMIFRTFHHVAYGLVLASNEPVAVADHVTSP
jgi:hypothetical protein